MVSEQPDPNAQPLSHRDLDHTPEDGNRYEIIDGALHVTPFPTPAHQHAVTQLVYFLVDHVRAGRLGRVFTAGLKVVLDETTGIGPDIVYISNVRLDALQPDGYYGAPDLVVEVLSSKPALDQLVKKQKYAQGGIPHYWIVDPTHRTLHGYRLEAGRYRQAAELGDDATFQPELFPDLRIPLHELWL